MDRNGKATEQRAPTDIRLFQVKRRLDGILLSFWVDVTGLRSNLR
jgi:hypothetical protein